jgi:hypothetical protein
MIERTKRHFNGTAPTGKKISEILPLVLNEIEKKTGGDREKIFQFWRSLLGEKMALLTQPISLKNGILTIKIKSATLYSLLCQHEKARLLKEMQAKFEIIDLVFRVG